MVDGGLPQDASPQTEQQRQGYSGEQALQHGEQQPGSTGQRPAQTYQHEKRPHQRETEGAHEPLGSAHETRAGALLEHERKGGHHGNQDAEQIGAIEEKTVLTALVESAQIQHSEEEGLIAAEAHHGQARLTHAR